MQFEFTEEQTMIRQMVSDFARDHASSQQVRQAMARESGFHPDSWQVLSRDLGIAGLLVPDNLGGQGLGLIEMALVFEQLGQYLLPSPLLQTGVIGPTLLLNLQDKALQQHWLPQLASGQRTVAVARLVDGIADYVVGGHCADVLMLFSETINNELYIIDTAIGERQGIIRVARQDMMDQTRAAGRIEVLNPKGMDEHRVADGPAAKNAIECAEQCGHIAVAAEAVGSAQSCLDITVQYVKDRHQFGRAIGSFQAVKHQLADMMVHIEAARSAVYFSACSVAEEPLQLPEMASLARVQASEALSLCAAEMIQLHGGIGFTWEHDAHLYFKRARSTATLLATNSVLDEVIAEQLGLCNEGVS